MPTKKAAPEATPTKRSPRKKPAAPIADGWRNRIVSSGVTDASTLMASPGNARRHPAAQRAALKGVLNEVGWVARVIVNTRSGLIVDGHLRVEEAAARNEQVPVDYVDLSPSEEAMILAMFDPIGALAETDRASLDALLGRIETVDTDVLDFIGHLAELPDVDPDGVPEENYTRKIEAPVYTITGAKPKAKELTDRTKADELRVRIEAVQLPKDVRSFLLDAAERHVVFRFDRIAEFYAHAAAAVQELMEDSVLVIIDFDRAIETGFVKLTEEIAARYSEDALAAAREIE